MSHFRLYALIIFAALAWGCAFVASDIVLTLWHDARMMEQPTW